MEQARSTIRKTYNAIYSILKPVVSFVYPFNHVGRENIPEGPAIFCATHSHYVDPLLVAMAVGRKNMLRIMAKKELFKNPIVGRVFMNAGVIPVNRGENDIDAIRTAVKCLKNGDKVLIFPEGTRTPSDNMKAKTGAVRIASKLGVPIVPVYVPRGKKAFGLVTIKIGQYYYVNAKTHEEYEAASEDLMRRILALKGKKR